MKTGFLTTYILITMHFAGTAWSQNLIVHYPMYKDAVDNSSNKNNGQLIGGVYPDQDRFGNPCGALAFNGIDGYIEVPNSTSFNSISQELTIAVWFKLKPPTTPTEFKWLTVVCKGENAYENDINPHFRLQTFQSSSQSTISINSDFTEYDLNFRNHLFEYDSWAFYAIVYDGKTVNAFLNGNLIWQFPYNKKLLSNSSSMHIGRDIPGSTEHFYGSLDDLKIFNKALSNIELQQLYNEDNSDAFIDEFSIKCPNNINSFTEKNSCSNTVTFDMPLIDVNCGNGQISIKQISGLTSGSSFPVGTNSIIFQAESASGLKKTCYSTINVIDSIAPLINFPLDTIIIIRNNIDSSIAFSYSLPVYSDNCKGATIELISGLPTNSHFGIGLNTLKFRATDKSGNISYCKYNVVIQRDKSFAPINSGQNIINENHSNTKPQPLQDSVKYLKEIGFNKCLLTVVMYDDGQQDFDTISVYFNGKEIVKREMIQLKKNGPIVKTLVILEHEKNDFIVQAWNNGNISPNTLKLEFYEGYFMNNLKKINRKKPNQTFIIHSKPGLACGINLSCNTK